MDSVTPSHSGHGNFPATRWSLVLEAQDSDPEALARLCGDYWKPLYVYACRRTGDPESAKDLTQSFFEHLLSRESLRQARQDKGKLRTFLLTALKRHSIDQWRAGQRAKRGGGQRLIELDGLEDWQVQAMGVRDGLTPELEFDRAWARQLLDGVMGKLRTLYDGMGKVDLFEALRERVEGQEDGKSYAEVGGMLGVSEGSVRLAVFKLRQRYRGLLQETIAETVSSPEELAEEIQYLRSVFVQPL